jgi:hypothetical protein
LLAADGHRLGGETPGKRADGVRPVTAAIAPGYLSGRRLGETWCRLEEALHPRFYKTQKLVGRHPQRLAHLVNEGEARLDLGPLVAGIAVLLDAQRPGEIAGAIEPALGAHGFQAFGKLQTHFGCEHRSHCARRFRRLRTESNR